MRIILAFWGLARSLENTLDSIQSQVLSVLRKHFDVTTFFHSYTSDQVYFNPRARERGFLDSSSYKLLKADFVHVENQDEIWKNEQLHKLLPVTDPWPRSKWKTSRNYVLACRSKLKLWKMIEQNTDLAEISAVVFCRPDCTFVEPIDVSDVLQATRSNNTIFCPSWGMLLWSTGLPKVNDRMAICSTACAHYFAQSPFQMLKHRLPMTSEQLLSKIYRDNGIILRYFDQFFYRTRLGGVLESRDTCHFRSRNLRLARRRRDGMCTRNGEYLTP